MLPHEQREALKIAFVEFLTRYRFTCFGNLTFAGYMGPSTCRARVNSYLKKISLDEGIVPFIFVVQEMQKRTQVHYHFLADWGLGVRLNPMSLMERWKWGYSRIYEIANDEDALRYVSKYCYNDESYYADYWIFDKDSLPEFSNKRQLTIPGVMRGAAGRPPG